MAYLVAILIPLVLLVAFVILTVIERKRGVRVLSNARASLDATASRVAVSARSLEPLAILGRNARRLAGHIIHDIATVALAAVRSSERFLSGLVRRLRSTRTSERTETRSGFLKSISYFKRTLRGTEKSSSEETTEGKVE
jgi:hypothetical protein